MTPEAIALTHLADVAGEKLQSGEEHVGKGLLSIRGQELFSVYRYALNAIKGKGLASQAEVQNQLDDMDQKMRELG
jgi:hypothetical protein